MAYQSGAAECAKSRPSIRGPAAPWTGDAWCPESGNRHRYRIARNRDPTKAASESDSRAENAAWRAVLATSRALAQRGSATNPWSARVVPSRRLQRETNVGKSLARQGELHKLA